MSVSVMLKPASSCCNLSCKYCFYHSLSHEREEFSKGMMSTASAQKIIDSALSFADGGDVYFTFQGGEPLLCPLEFYESFVDYTSKNNTSDCTVHYCLQTNGTLINEDFAQFFSQNGFLVGVSLDGCRELNSYRLYSDGEESFDDVMRGIELLNKYKVSFNVLCVLTKRTALDFRKAYRFFKKNNLRYIQFIPALRPFKTEYDEEMFMSCEDYAYFLTKAFNIYYNDYMRGDFVSVRSFDNYIALLNGKNAEQCGMNGFCSTQFALEADGSIYPCDFFCTDEWYLGNINEISFGEIYRLPKMAEFLKESFKLDDECRDCKYFSLCRGGGCKRSRIDKNYCTAYKKFFSESEYKMKQIKF